jgi:hypothetical protein
MVVDPPSSVSPHGCAPGRLSWGGEHGPSRCQRYGMSGADGQFEINAGVTNAQTVLFGRVVAQRVTHLLVVHVDGHPKASPTQSESQSADLLG